MANIFKLLKKHLWLQILVGMALGVIVGLVLKENAVNLKPLGDIFVRLIKMIVVPLIFLSITAAIVQMEDANMLGRLGIKSFVLYLMTTAVAITIGLVVANVMNLGSSFDLTKIIDFNGKIEVAEGAGAMDMLVGLIPTNPFKAFAEGNILQVIVFAILLGISIKAAGRKSENVARLIEGGAESIYKMTGLIMKFAPIGVFGLIAWVAGTQDSELLVSLLQLIACLYLACILHIIIVYGGLLKFATGLSVFKFFKKIVPAQLMAYSTASSAATLPVTMQVAETKLGVSKVTSSFVLPLGTTVNMDGTALYQGICVIFVANGLGYDLTTADYVTIVLTSTLASIGSAGVPGAGLIMLSLVLSSVGLPSAEVIGLIAGVDRIMDMMRTTVNVTGDSVVALIVDKHEKTLNEEMFNDAPSTVSS